MPIRNPFARRTAADEPTLRPESAGNGSLGDLPKLPSFERVDTVGSMASSSTSMRSRRSQDTGDYKMSVVNDSGVYLPPSPTSERDAFWSTSASANGSNGGGHRRTYITSLSASLSRSSTDNNGHSPTAASRSSLGDIEPFSISRESFDSYRRSFDISAKSPVVASSEWGNGCAGVGRQSLDSSTFRRNNTSSSNGSGGNSGGSQRHSRLANEQRFPPADEGFEDVGLDDGRHGAIVSHHSTSEATTVPTTAGSVAANFMRKRGAFFSKFGSDHVAENAAAADATKSTRKRAPSGQGAELTPMDRNTSRPLTAIAAEPQEAQ